MISVRTGKNTKIMQMKHGSLDIEWWCCLYFLLGSEPPHHHHAFRHVMKNVIIVATQVYISQ